MDIQHIPLKFLFDTNCYLIKTEKGYILIDTGIKNRRKQLEKAITDAGCHPGDLKLIIITHGHIDHIGNAAYLQDKYGAKIAMHKGDINMVTGGGMFADAPPSLMIRILTVFMNITGMGDFETFTPDILLENNQSLEEYGLEAKVIHTLGHSKGSICIHTASGLLFSGDIFNGSTDNVTTIVDDQSALDETVEYLKKLNAQTFYPGHGNPFNR